MPYLCIFRLKIKKKKHTKKIDTFEVTLDFQNAKFSAKRKIHKFGTKMSYLDVFGLGYENSIVIFQISKLEFVYLLNFVKKQKYLNL